MQDEAWKIAIERWRALPEDEKARRRWEAIPRSVAQNMAAAGEPVSLAVLEAEHAKLQMPTRSLQYATLQRYLPAVKTAAAKPPGIG